MNLYQWIIKIIAIPFIVLHRIFGEFDLFSFIDDIEDEIANGSR